MLVLIDADTLCYASAAMAEGESEGLARWNVDAGLKHLLIRLNDPEYKLYVTGDNNFRHKVYPEYKANRLKTARPTFLASCKAHLINEYGALCSDGCEADDMLGIEQMANAAHGIETMISSIDKDLNMIPGWHYSPELTRGGVVIKPERQYVVSPLDAIKFFYGQLLTGDPTDNIKGVRGMGKVGAAKIIGQVADVAVDEAERVLLSLVREAYGCDEEMEMNAKVLWIWRKENDNIVDRWKQELAYCGSDAA